MNTDKSIELAPKNDIIYVKQTQLSYIWYKSYSFKMIAEFWIVEGYKMGKHSEVLWKGKQNTQVKFFCHFLQRQTTFVILSASLGDKTFPKGVYFIGEKSVLDKQQSSLKN